MTASPRTILVVLGTRPEAIKLAPVVLEMRRRGGPLAPRILATGQHRDLLAGALETFGLVADANLELMVDGQSLSVLAGRALIALDGFLAESRPDVVLVQGDTTTTMCGALAAFHRDIAVGHVEAGLRTGDIRSPFPEELNRRIATTVTRHHFAPTARARDALRHEGIDDARIVVTGNTGIDALFAALARPCPLDGALGELRASGAPFAVVTLHRRESFGPDLEAVCTGVRRLLDRVPELRVVVPLHPNPRVREAIPRILGDHPRAHLVQPMDYLPFAHLLAAARFVVTDSGGIQEECPSLGKPVMVVRRVTERPEAVEAGSARLIGPDPHALVALGERLVTDGPDYAAMATPRPVYGDGHAAGRIVDYLERQLGVVAPVAGGAS